MSNDNKPETNSISKRDKVFEFFKRLENYLFGENKDREKIISRVEVVFDDINKNYPELDACVNGVSPHPIEQVKAYYQIKQIENQRRQTWIIIFLTIISIILAYSNFYLTSDYYKTMIISQGPLFIPIVGDCPVTIHDSLYYSFSFRNGGKNTGSVTATIIRNESASYKISPETGWSVLPTESGVFNLDVKPFPNSERFNFSIEVKTNNGNCFIKTCEYSQVRWNDYKKSNNDSWSFC